MEHVTEVIKEIKENLTQTAASSKDEVRVMRAMLNDTEYKVDVYGKEGVVGQYCPAEDVRSTFAGVIASTTKIPHAEAEGLMSSYEFKKSDAETMINVGKEFINTYTQTGRKLPLGGRATSNVALSMREVPASTRTYPKKVGVSETGAGRYENAPTTIKAHTSLKVHAPCPSWVEDDKK